MCWPLYHRWFWVGQDTGRNDVFRCSLCGVQEVRPRMVVTYTTAPYRYTSAN
jgi:hypothetical protein